MSGFGPLLRNLSEARLRDVPNAARKAFSSGQVSASFASWARAYGDKYLKKGSAAPIVHTMIGLGVLGYILEYPHLSAHERNRKHH